MIRITIETDNAAFGQPNYCAEIQRILVALARRFEFGENARRINDINGNGVCRITYTGKDKD